MYDLGTLLDPQVLTRVISQQAGASSWLLNMFGCQPGGSSEISLGHGRRGSYNVFNDTRKVAKVTAPGTAANRRGANPMASIPFTYPRMHDSIFLLAEDVNNIGRIDDPATRDQMGERWIAQQTGHLAQLSSNFRKAMIAGTLRDSLYFVPDGEAFAVTFDSTVGSPAVPALQVEQKMPAGNKGQLNMLGTGGIIDASWATATTDIVNHLGQINRAFSILNGGYLAAVILPWQQWNNILKNTSVQDVHGTSTAPFTAVTTEQTLPPGTRGARNFVARLNFIPDTMFYVTDEVMDLGPEGSEVQEPIVPATNAIFVGHDPMSDVIEQYLGSEPVAEYDGASQENKVGLASWSTNRSNPTGADLFALDNSLTVNHVPDSVAYGTVEF